MTTGGYILRSGMSRSAFSGPRRSLLLRIMEFGRGYGNIYLPTYTLSAIVHPGLVIGYGGLSRLLLLLLSLAGVSTTYTQSG